MVTHFDWENSDYIDACVQLKKRDIQRKTRKDSDLMCRGRCGKKPKRGEYVYYPSEQLGKHNKVIGHVECVERIYAEQTSKPVKENGSSARDKLLNALGKGKPAKPFLGTVVPAKPDVSARLEKAIQSAKQQQAGNNWDAGRQHGREEAYEEITEILIREFGLELT